MMLDSYKVRVMLITAALLFVPVIGAFVLVVLGKADASAFFDLAKWAAGSLGLTGTGTVLAHGLADAAAVRGPRAINAAGDVTVIPDPDVTKPGGVS